MFRKYSCDCIGFEVTDEETGEMHAYCVQACDSDRGGLSLWLRPDLLNDPDGGEVMSFAASAKLIEAMNSLMTDGHRFRTVQSSLLAEEGVTVENAMEPCVSRPSLTKNKSGFDYTLTFKDPIAFDVNYWEGSEFHLKVVVSENTIKEIIRVTSESMNWNTGVEEEE